MMRKMGVYNWLGVMGPGGAQGPDVHVHGRVVGLPARARTHRGGVTARVTIPMPRLLDRNMVVYRETVDLPAVQGLELNTANVHRNARNITREADNATIAGVVNTVWDVRSAKGDLSPVIARLLTLDIHISQTGQFPNPMGEDVLNRARLVDNAAWERLWTQLESLTGYGGLAADNVIPLMVDPHGGCTPMQPVVAHVIIAACRNRCGLPPYGGHVKHLCESIFPDALDVYWVTGRSRFRALATEELAKIGHGVSEELAKIGHGASHTAISSAIRWLEKYGGLYIVTTRAVHMVAAAQRFLPPEMTVVRTDPANWVTPQMVQCARLIFNAYLPAYRCRAAGRQNWNNDQRQEVAAMFHVFRQPGQGDSNICQEVPEIGDVPAALRLAVEALPADADGTQLRANLPMYVFLYCLRWFVLKNFAERFDARNPGEGEANGRLVDPAQQPAAHRFFPDVANSVPAIEIAAEIYWPLDVGFDRFKDLLTLGRRSIIKQTVSVRSSLRFQAVGSIERVVLIRAIQCRQ